MSPKAQFVPKPRRNARWIQIVVYGVAWFGAYNVALNLAAAPA